jgi:hypothetical protein
MTESPALILQEQLANLATDTHDVLMDVGCNCQYVVTASWQKASFQNPSSRILHAPECYTNALPPGGEPDASDATETKPAAPVTRTRKPRPTKSAAVPPEDSGEQRSGD